MGARATLSQQADFGVFLGTFVTTYTEQLASGFEKEDWMGTEGKQ